jgi:mono/diheme cytochrome c family protein
MAYVVASVAGVAFFVLSVLLLGVWPRRVLEAETRAMAPEHTLPLTASEARGRAIYGREGCAYCHTQQVRYLHADMTRFGAPTLAWEGRFDYPQLWGTRRIGPDLGRESGSRTDDWQFGHLFAPRAIAPLSVMPAYRALFDRAPDRPTGEGRDLVAYLATLGRARELAAPEGEVRARAACQCDDDEMAQMAFGAESVSAHPARARRTGDVPDLPAAGDRAAGARLFADHCVGCHGANGAGDGPGAAGLRPRPSDLSAHRYSSRRLAESLWNGVAGTSMPGWRDHSVDHLSALAEFVRGLSAAAAEAPPPAAGANDPGARVYAEHCVQCHGERGGGDGFLAAALPIAPTNFRSQQASQAASTRAVTNGIDGTPMAPWASQLSPAEIAAVAQFVRGFYDGGAPRGGGRP